MKILLVEDDSALRLALEELLLREGYEVKKAANCREARDGLDGSIDFVMSYAVHKLRRDDPITAIRMDTL